MHACESRIKTHGEEKKKVKILEKTPVKLNDSVGTFARKINFALKK